MLTKLLSVGILALLVNPAQADSISVSQAVDKTEVAFEGLVHLEIELTWQGPQTAYLFDKPLNPEFEGLKVRKLSTSVSSAGTGANEITTKRFKYTLVPTASGQGAIRPIEIDYVTWPDSLPGQLVTDAMSVMIAEPKPVALPDEGGSLSLIVAVGIVAVLIAGLFVGAVVIRRRKPQVVVKSPREKFLEDLARLKTETGTDLKRFQTGLFRHLVTYLSAQYDVDLANFSSEQIGEALEKTDIVPAQQERILGWLERAEREKFSPIGLAPGENIRLEAEIREFFDKM